MRSLKPLLLSSLLILATGVVSWSGEKTSLNGDWVITKDLLGASGTSLTAQGDYSMAYAWGESISGHVALEPTYTVISGYYGGRFGSAQSMTVTAWQVETASKKTFYQDRVQIGVPFDAPILITLSDQVDETSIKPGIQVVVTTDHLGQASTATSSYTYISNSADHTIEIRPPGTWMGNTLYDIQVTPQLLSVDQFTLDQVYHIYFLTILDPRQENVVTEPVIPQAIAADATSGSAGVMEINIPASSLSDFSAVLLSRDPLNSPLRVDPKIIQEANDKARAAGGAYRVPLAIQEISAYNAQGELMDSLSNRAQITLNYSGGFGASATAGLVRPQTLALWVLDETHKLWVKIPSSQNSTGFQTVTAPVSHFSVFALMGGQDGSAADSYAFPVPWRPHGPNAGTGAGQSGTEEDGINFSSIPSECTIKIYTIAGELVRAIHHTDTGVLQNRDKWDVKTMNGEPVASGVYLWRVESSADGKNGKLMVIR